MEPFIQPDQSGTVLQIPFELLSDIFLLSLQAYPPGSDSLRPNRPPWTLVNVCRHWRYVALSTPLLWASLPWLNTNSAPKKLRHFLRLSLQRSSPALFSLNLTAYLPERTFDKIHKTLPLLDDILPHIDRCCELTLLANAHVIPHLDELTRMTALHSLTLKFHGACIDFPTLPGHLHSIGLDFGNNRTPQLRNFTVEAPLHIPGQDKELDCAPVVFDWVRVPWDQLTSFTATSMPAVYVLEALRHASRLRDVTVRETWVFTNDFDEHAS